MKLIMDYNKYGLNGQYIYRKDLLNDFKKEFPDGDCVWNLSLNDWDRVYNSRWTLLYKKEDDAFLLMTDDPNTHYLPYNEIFRQWYTYDNYKI